MACSSHLQVIIGFEREHDGVGRVAHAERDPDECSDKVADGGYEQDNIEQREGAEEDRDVDDKGGEGEGGESAEGEEVAAEKTLQYDEECDQTEEGTNNNAEESDFPDDALVQRRLRDRG